MNQLTRRALLTRIVKGPPPPKFRIDESRCFVFKGPECGACAGLCPEGVEALTLRAGRPSIDRAACTGCGDCVDACPISPAAIVVE